MVGFAKSQSMQLHEQGYYCAFDKFVCPDCIGNKVLQEFIKDNAEIDICDYCKSDGEGSYIAVNLEKVLKVIMDGIHYEWEDPNNSVGWDGREGGWQGVRVIDTYDLITDELAGELELENDQLIDDIWESISDQQWCERDPYSLRRYEEDLTTWNLFSRQVKHETRYVFFQTEDPNKEYSYADVYLHPHEILVTIGESIEKLELVKYKDKCLGFYRGRTHVGLNGFSKVDQLTTPKIEYSTKPNRMSPAGIPMFYGSLEESTALEEIRDGNPFVTVGKFEPLIELNLIDLSVIPEYPSLFDESKRSLRDAVIFIREFVRDLSKPLEKDTTDHIEYVPTQIVTEFFRRIYKLRNGERVHGILYPSSKVVGGICSVLFIENEQCTQDKKDESCILNLESSMIHTKAFPM